MITCKNCSNSVEGKYCSNCGQKASIHRFNVSHFFEETVHAVTHADKGALLLAKELFYRPGHVAKDYIGGMRKKYFNPLTYLLIMIAFHAIAVQKSGIMEAYFSSLQQKSALLIKNMDEKTAKEGEQAISKEMQKASAKSKKINENNRAMMMMLIPGISLLTWLFFKRSGYNYAENLILNVLIMGQLELFSLLLLILPFMLFPSAVFWLFMFQAIYMVGYSIFAYKQFFGQSWGATILKGLLAQFIYFSIAAGAANLLAWAL